MDTYWSKQDIQELAKAQTYTDLLTIAKRVLARMPRPIVQVCGPISTGGAGSMKKNLERFDRAIQVLRAKGINLFNQMPFEEPMQLIRKREANGYSVKLLEEFYLPIFRDRLIDELFFLPDWQSSTGAKWEHEQGKRFGLKISYLEGKEYQ